MTELYPPLSTLTEFSPYAILIQNISPAHGTLVHSISYDKITSAITNDVAVFLINNTLFYMQIYLEWSVRMVYNFLDLTQNGLCLCTNRYLIYRRILIIWLSFQRHIMYRHDFISLVQHKLRLPTLTLRQIKVLSIDLGLCYTHQSYYTCLSQSASADGTVIVQGFDSKKITGGLSGFMRQEFRDLEILNKITEERFLGHMSKSVSGNLRNSLIRSYRIYKGKHLDTTEWHPHIQWRNGEDKIPEVENDGTWDMKVSQEIVSMGVVKKKPTVKSKNTATKHHIDTSSNLQEVKENPVTSGSSKRSRSGAIIEDNTRPTGLTWDSRNYSCAFDAIITILYHVWKQSDDVWRNTVGSYSEYMQTLIDGFEEVKLGNTTLEQTRNRVRLKLNRINSNIFPLGHNYSDITELSAYIMGYGNCGGSYKRCPNCGKEDDGINTYFD